jgi:hypothetical protein
MTNLKYDYQEVKKELNYPECMDFSMKLFEPVTRNKKVVMQWVYDPRVEDPTILEARDKKYISKLYDDIEMNERKLQKNLVKRAKAECRRAIRDAKDMIRILEAKTYVDTNEIPQTT